jgi:hypothetical protein
VIILAGIGAIALIAGCYLSIGFWLVKDDL